VSRLVELEAGKPFNLLALDSTVASMRERAAGQGLRRCPRRHVDVRRHRSARRRRDHHGEPARAHVRRRDLIDGNKDVSDRTIRNSLSFKTATCSSGVS
jgi:hypothetical protein